MAAHQAFILQFDAYNSILYSLTQIVAEAY